MHSSRYASGSHTYQGNNWLLTDCCLLLCSTLHADLTHRPSCLVGSALALSSGADCCEARLSGDRSMLCYQWVTTDSLKFQKFFFFLAAKYYYYTTSTTLLLLLTFKSLDCEWISNRIFFACSSQQKSSFRGVQKWSESTRYFFVTLLLMVEGLRHY